MQNQFCQSFKHTGKNSNFKRDEGIATKILKNDFPIYKSIFI
jgi:hypothetical protein